jgi:hypothetical protein
MEDDKNSSLIGTEKRNSVDVSQISDTTSLIDVKFFMQAHGRDLLDDPEIIDEVETFISAPIPENKREREILLDFGIDLLQHFSKQVNKVSHGMEAVSTTYFIRLGKLLIQLKRIMKRLGLREWDQWATRNIPFISQRARIDYMKLASRIDCHPFALLGMERLMLLIRATEDGKGNDRIEDFLRKYGINFDPESREILKTFKMAVDTAINLEKLEKLNVPVDPKLVEGLTEYKHVFDKDLLTTVKKIADSKGDPNEYFKKLVVNKGKEKDPFEGTKVIQDFNEAGARLLKILDYMEEHQEAHGTVEVEVIEELIEKLIGFKTKINNG